MTTTTDSPGNGFASIPNDLDGIERLCEQLYTAQDSTIRKHAESVLFPLSTNPRHLSQGTMILENAKVRLLLVLFFSFHSCIRGSTHFRLL